MQTLICWLICVALVICLASGYPASDSRLETAYTVRQQLADQRRDIKLRIRAMLREERIETLRGSGTFGPSLGSSG